MARACFAGLMTSESVATRSCFAHIVVHHGPMFSECPLVPQGTFEHNVFQGHGVLEWSVKAEHVRVIN